MWAVEQYLSRAGRDVDAKYDYRYSRLVRVLGQLLREGRVQECDLHGLSEDKLADIRRVAAN